MNVGKRTRNIKADVCSLNVTNSVEETHLKTADPKGSAESMQRTKTGSGWQRIIKSLFANASHFLSEELFSPQLHNTLEIAKPHTDKVAPAWRS